MGKVPNCFIQHAKNFNSALKRFVVKERSEAVNKSDEVDGQDVA